ncbi:MAG: PucR family transcriptional regulator ligand-binding domain-containing protein, partial [Micromonosporaceae bacterium]
MPTLRQLVDALGPDLARVGRVDALDTDVTGVHVSELDDPTMYLSGGELLLTTGMPFTDPDREPAAYVARLVRRGVCGLGFGLGPVHQEVPTALVAACDDAGLPVFSVPGPTPFLVVARTYWNQLVVAGRAELNAHLRAHQDLIRAVRGPNPVTAIVRVLAGAVGGWAARLDTDGDALDVWPKSRLATAGKLKAEVAWLREAGPHASATFPLGADDVVVQPLSRRRRITGFVVTAAPRAAGGPDGQLALAACALLTLGLDQRYEAVARSRSERCSILLLALAGHLDAARSLSDELGHLRVPGLVRLIAAAPPLAAGELLDRWERARVPGREVWVAEQADRVWVMATPDGATAVLDDLRTLTRSDVPELRAVASPPVPPDGLPRQRDALAAALSRCGPGQVPGDVPETLGERAARQVEALVGHRDGELVGAVAAYLRHRGHWDRGAATV